MKIYLVHAKKWLGPGTPYSGVVKEQDEAKAIEAFIDPRASPFESGEIAFRWFVRYKPSHEDFLCKCIGYDTIWPDEFTDELRDPEKNAGPIFSSEEKVCRLFMQDRIVLRMYRSGGSFEAWIFSVRLALADFFYYLAEYISERTRPKPTEIVPLK